MVAVCSGNERAWPRTRSPTEILCVKFTTTPESYGARPHWIPLAGFSLLWRSIDFAPGAGGHPSTPGPGRTWSRRRNDLAQDQLEILALVVTEILLGSRFDGLEHRGQFHKEVVPGCGEADSVAVIGFHQTPRPQVFELAVTDVVVADGDDIPVLGQGLVVELTQQADEVVLGNGEFALGQLHLDGSKQLLVGPGQQIAEKILTEFAGVFLV